MTESIQKQPRVVIFDSGVGGLSILREARALVPGCRFDYICDNGGFPYGTKTDDFVIGRTHHVIDRFLANCHYPVDMLVIACNTASTLALPRLRSAYSFPIIGVVPAIKPGASFSQTGYIGLLATPATIRREYTHNLIRDYAGHCQVISHGSSVLVSLAEGKLRGHNLDAASLAEELAPFTTLSAANPTPQRLDCLVLACTHFPLLKPEIQACLGEHITLLDSGEAIARRISYWCDHLGYPPQTGSPTEGCAWFTAESADIEALRPALAEFSLSTVNIIH